MGEEYTLSAALSLVPDISRLVDSGKICVHSVKHERVLTALLKNSSSSSLLCSTEVISYRPDITQRNPSRIKALKRRQDISTLPVSKLHDQWHTYIGFRLFIVLRSLHQRGLYHFLAGVERGGRPGRDIVKVIRCTVVIPTQSDC